MPENLAPVTDALDTPTRGYVDAVVAGGFLDGGGPDSTYSPGQLIDGGTP